MAEINLLDRYPRTCRDIASRAAAVPAQREVARRFGREYFDGDRGQGYGGYRYDGRWVPIAERLRDHYGLAAATACSTWAAPRAFSSTISVTWSRASGWRGSTSPPMPSSTPWRTSGASSCAAPPSGCRFAAAPSTWSSRSTRSTTSGARRASRPSGEIERVGRRHRYVQVDSWLTEEQREKFERWQLTAATYSDPEGWRRLFQEAGYTGDYYWTVTE